MELLAPCSNKETFLAALNAGADAIYLGGKKYSARAACDNFSLEEIKECIAIAHAIDVKVHVTVNTILYEDELMPCFLECEKYIAMGVDALIVQDLGLINLIHKYYPTFPIHASTQLNCHNLDQAKMLKKIGCSRIVLARETPLEVVKEIINHTNLEIEVFVHGALCVSCSGNCYISSFIGERSGNRGRCAQPCRLEGSIVSSSNKIGDGKYPLSMKDLCTLPYLDELEKIGVTSLKIEGRLKSKEYIYHVVKTYKEKLNHLDASLNEKLKVIKTTFNRGYTKGFIFNEAISRILNQNSSSHIGIELGRVSKVRNNSFYLVLKEDLSLHDGLRDMSIQEGFLLTHFKEKGIDIHFAKKGSYVEIITTLTNKIKVGDLIYKTKSKLLIDEVNFALNKIRKKNINAYFEARENHFMNLILSDDDISIGVYGNSIMEKGKNSFMDVEEIKARLNKSDGFPYTISHFELNIDTNLFYSIKELNELRRNAFKNFYEAKIEYNHHIYKTVNVERKIDNQVIKTQEIVSITTESQLNIVLKYPFSLIFAPTELYLKYKDKDNRIHLHKKRMGDNLITDKLSLSSYLSSSSSFISPYLNVINHESVALIKENNYQGVILSYETNFSNALKIKANLNNINIYYPIYSYVTYMYLKSCPICTSFKKEGKCGLCRKEQYYYVDRKNVKYPLLTTKECYVKILSPLPLSLISKKEMIKKDFSPYFAFTIEDEIITKNVLEAYFNDGFETYEHMLGHFYEMPL